MDKNNSEGQNCKSRMTEHDFLETWQSEKSMYEAWGSFVVSEICSQLKKLGRDINQHLKQPAIYRLKTDNSLVDKAFYRPDKKYKDPYIDIEDKVACRFVVLLIDHIDELSQLIKTSEYWDFKECRHFDEERKKSPLLFTYQSVHYVVRAKKDIQVNNGVVLASTPCEIQIRTLLQHAYAELTHDAIYKAKKIVEPEIHRTVAKSMALIETTDDFFSDVNRKLNCGVVENISLKSELDKLYFHHIGIEPTEQQKSAVLILDVFESIISDDLVEKLDKFMIKNDFISSSIKGNCHDFPFFTQSVVIFVYWLIMKKRQRLLEDWPLDRNIIERIASQSGISLDR